MSPGVAEFYALLMFCAVGMLLIASVNDFILLFVSLELVTITFYVLASYLRRWLISSAGGGHEVSLILGALSSGFSDLRQWHIFSARREPPTLNHAQRPTFRGQWHSTDRGPLLLGCSWR